MLSISDVEPCCSRQARTKFSESCSVIILALNQRKSGQIANKGFMIYDGSNPEKSQAKILFKFVKLSNSQPAKGT